jgi:hypothetical protein
MTISELMVILANLQTKAGLPADTEVTVEGQAITGESICTYMRTGEVVVDLGVDDSERLDLEDHPAFEGS